MALFFGVPHCRIDGNDRCFVAPIDQKQHVASILGSFKTLLPAFDHAAAMPVSRRKRAFIAVLALLVPVRPGIKILLVTNDEIEAIVRVDREHELIPTVHIE